MSDIVRVSGDTYPETKYINIEGVPVNLTGWTVYMYYTETQYDGSIIDMRITGVVTKANKGEVKFYPRSEYCQDITNDVPVNGFSVTGTHAYSVVREKLINGYPEKATCETGDVTVTMSARLTE